MSMENIERQRGLVRAFNARDIEAFIEYSAPEIELHSAFAAVGGAVYEGHDGLRQWRRDFDEAWAEDVRAEVDAYFDLGDDVLSFYVLHGRSRHSGAPVEMANALYTRWRDGKLTVFKVYAHREDAIRDLGVTETELERITP